MGSVSRISKHVEAYQSTADVLQHEDLPWLQTGGVDSDQSTDFSLGIHPTFHPTADAVSSQKWLHA